MYGQHSKSATDVANMLADRALSITASLQEGQLFSFKVRCPAIQHIFSHKVPKLDKSWVQSTM